MRAAAAPLTQAPSNWPNLSTAADCRAWIRDVWELPELADAVGQASPSLESRVRAILAGKDTSDRQVRRATIALVRYTLRTTGRPTPFGLFAGIAPLRLGDRPQVRWGKDHTPVIRPDAEWLASVITQLEAVPEVLERLDVTFNNLTTQRGARLEVPHESRGFSIRSTALTQVVRKAAAAPIRFSSLVETVSSSLPGAEHDRVSALLSTLVQCGFLITCLRAPVTTIDPLAHALSHLRRVQAETARAAIPLLRELETVRHEIARHNRSGQPASERATLRGDLTRRLRELSRAGRTPLAVDLRLDCDAVLPASVAVEMERAADVLLRLSRHRPGPMAWRDYHAAFCDRYGTGTLVPLTDVVDRDTGLGYPAGFPGSTAGDVVDAVGRRDERLLGLAWRAVNSGAREVVLTEDLVQDVVGQGRETELRPPADVELSARIRARSIAALQRGDFRLTVSAGRAAGTLTARFAHLVPNAQLGGVYGRILPATHGALPVQLSVSPIHRHAENVCRIPAYLPHVLTLGELHRRNLPERSADGPDLISLDDLAVTATRDALQLVSMSRRQVIEPHTFHALSLESQLTPLARFVAEIPRAFRTTWQEFTWGPVAEQLPYLPRLRYGRSVLSPERWYVRLPELAGTGNNAGEWQQLLRQWRVQWRCPRLVELRDGDHTLRLDLEQPAHCAVLHAHLKRYHHATLTETDAHPSDYGWLGGHAHEVVLPLFTKTGSASVPRTGSLPVVSNRSHGEFPGSPGANWLYAKIYVHSSRQRELLTDRLPELLDDLDGDPSWWFVRYRDTRARDQLRLRITTDGKTAGAYATKVGSWAESLRRSGLASRLVLDTYLPEVGRYGQKEAMEAAEAVFVADSSVALTEMRRQPDGAIDPTALVAINMVAIAEGFLGTFDDAMTWLLDSPAPMGSPVKRSVLNQVISSVRHGAWGSPNLNGQEVSSTWEARSAALKKYRMTLPDGTDIDAVLESLLHMHHNRALGINRDRERSCRRLARQAALAWQARRSRA